MIKAAIYAGLLALALVGGSGLQRRLDIQAAAKVAAATAVHAGDPMNLLALVECGKLTGALVIDKSGGVKMLPPTDEGALEAVAKRVAPDHVGVVTAPCGNGGTEG